MDKPKCLYVVFSSTKCGIGGFIRFMTRNLYNHMSVTLDPSLATLYSFARYHKSAPFYGGFVCESCLRYQGDALAKVKVVAIPLTDEQYENAVTFFDGMKKSNGRYIYNTLSAITNIFRRKVRINDAYTCVEFAVNTLDTLGVDERISAKRFYSIKQLESILAESIIYEGNFPDWADNAQWGDDLFKTPTGFFKGSKNTIRSHIKLLKRLVKAG